MSILFQNARVLTPFAQQDGDVLVAGDRIVDVARAIDPRRGTRVVDAQGHTLVPGYIDLRVTAGGGHSVEEATPEAIAALAAAHAAEGTTSQLAAIYPAAPEAMAAQLQAVRAANSPYIAGVHLQGPHLAPEHVPAAAHPHLLPPDSGALEDLLALWPDGVRIVGISPELSGSAALGERLRAAGIVASISHSDASFDQVLSALSHGFTDVTNIFRQTSSLREAGGLLLPGVTECTLTMDELTVQIVADGRQLPMSVLQMIFRCKGAENILLVSGVPDAEAPTPIAQQVRNMVTAGVSLRVALRMATAGPARRIGLDAQKGRIAPGYDADLLLLDDTLEVALVMAGGQILRDSRVPRL